MASTSATLSTSVLKKAIDRYYKELQDYQGKADYELAVRTAFLNLLHSRVPYRYPGMFQIDKQSGSNV